MCRSATSRYLVHMKAPSEMNVPVANRTGVIRGWPFHCAESICLTVYADRDSSFGARYSTNIEVHLTSKTAARSRT